MLKNLAVQGEMQISTNVFLLIWSDLNVYRCAAMPFKYL